MNLSIVFLLEIVLASICVSEIILDKDKFTNAFVDHLNNVAEQNSAYGEPAITRIEKIDDIKFYIEIIVKETDLNDLTNVKYLNCSGIATDLSNSVIVRDTQCTDYDETGDVTEYTSEGPIATAGTDSIKDLVTDLTTDDGTGDGPIHLENEIQPSNTTYTSGEQFIAIPRERPMPCAGCASLVDPKAVGVTDLATLGLRQLDRHEPNTRHFLNDVLLVERQVQVVGGVRYTIIFNVDYDNCTSQDTEDCTFQKICKVAVLEKPWKKSANGSKFRAILSNNCTEDWIFDGSSSDSTDNSSPIHEFGIHEHSGNLSYKISDENVQFTDDAIKMVHEPEVHAQPTVEKVLTEDQMKDLEGQIIPLIKDSKSTPTINYWDREYEITREPTLTDNRVFKLNPTDVISSSQLSYIKKETKEEEGLSGDKKKAVDELMSFFAFAGVKPAVLRNGDKTRIKRDYGKDLDALMVFEKFQNMRSKLKNALFIHKLAQVMVDYLNENDNKIKNRTLKNVVSAEEESENDQKYYYIEADVVMPCDKVECKPENKEIRTCSGIIGAAQREPSVLYAVCYEAQKRKNGQFKPVQDNDPILLKLVYEALRGLEIETHLPHPLRMKKILRASTQTSKGFFTKVTVEIEYVDCNRSVPIFNRSNCTVLEKMGSQVCDFEIRVKNNWDEKKISRVCIARPIGERFVELSEQHVAENSSDSFKDPHILEIVQQALQYLEVKSNRNNKQKLVKIISVSKQSVAGLLTRVVFFVGYTVCKNEYNEDLTNCELIANEPLRNCTVEMWERPWLDDDKQVKVDCEDVLKSEKGLVNQISQQRAKRSADYKIVGGPLEKDTDDSRYKNLAEESLQKFILASGSTQHYKVIKITKVTVQVVSGTLTKIYFDIAPTNCQVDASGRPTSSSCVAQMNPENINCHSSVWERPWLKSNEIECECNVGNKKSRRKRHIQNPGKELNKDPYDSKYFKLAKGSLQEYLLTYAIPKYYIVEDIEEVTKVEAPGEFFKIDFSAVATNCTMTEAEINSSLCVKQSFENTYSCHLDYWNKPLFKSTITNINCQLNEKKLRSKRQLGGASEQPVTETKYRTLAEESVAQYVSESGITQHYKVAKIYKVTTQIVSGSLTKIHFKIVPTSCQVDNEGRPTSSDCRIKDVSGVLKCHAEIWQKPSFTKKEITVRCTPVKRRFTRAFSSRVSKNPDKSRLIREILPGGDTPQNVSDPKYFKLAEESLTKYVISSGIKQYYKPIQIIKVTTQIVSGLLTRIDFKSSETNCEVDINGKPNLSVCEVKNPQNTIFCHSSIWEQRWINKKEINVNCTISVARQKRNVDPRETTQDPKNLKFVELAKESLNTYTRMYGLGEHEHTLLEVERVTTQLVAGKLTKLEFSILPAKCLNTSSHKNSELNCQIRYCYSQIWERSWIKTNNKTIKVSCDEMISLYGDTNFYNVDNLGSNLFNDSIILADNRGRRSSLKSGGDQEQNPNDPQYRRLALESLKKYQRLKKSQYSHRVVKVDRVISRIVSGIIYKIDYTAVQTTCPSNVTKLNLDNCDSVENTTLYCHTEIWDRPWLKRKKVDIFCGTYENDDYDVESTIKRRVKRNVINSDNLLTSNESNSEHKLLDIDVSGFNVSNINQKYAEEMLTINNNFSLDLDEHNQHNISHRLRPNTVQEKYNHDKVFDIDVPGLNVSNDANDYEKFTINNSILLGNDIQKPTKNNFRPNYVLYKKYNDQYYIKLARDALEKFQNMTNTNKKHKVIQIHYASERVDGGLVVCLEFSAAPTTCLVSQKNETNCEILKPILSCHADVHIVSVLDNKVVKQIKIDCNEPKKKRRNRRQINPSTEEYVDDELKYFYADRIVSKYNQGNRVPNLHKLITIYDVRRSTHMKVDLIRMYVEVAKTYCMRDGDEHELARCTEIEAIPHKVCLGRVWPSSYDEYILTSLHVVCDDEQSFQDYSGYNPFELVGLCMKFINSQKMFSSLVVPALEKKIYPSLDYKEPIVVLFAVLLTNCSNDRPYQSKHSCLVQDTQSVISCRADVYLLPNEKRLVDAINATCIPITRSKRSVLTKSENYTDEDLEIQKLVQESLDKLEMQSVHNYKQRVLLINSYSSEVRNGKETTIDFDVGYTNCLKYEWVDNITKCEFLEHLPRRHCVSHITERLFVHNGRNIEVACTDDETPLEANMEFESAKGAKQLANQALKHIEYKYPDPRKQKVLRIFSLEKQVAAGIHYRMKLEVGYTKCMALSEEEDCDVDVDAGMNKFCRVNVWVRSWTNHPPSYRVTCDYNESSQIEVYYSAQVEELFRHFLQTYRPYYLDDPVVLREKFSIFSENVKKIHELNIYEMGTARYAITRFADLSPKEFRQLWGGWNSALRDENQVPMPAAEIPTDSALPAAFDWRDHDAVTDVKDQGMCGSCWAFSVTGNIEGQWKKHSGKLVSLSEQELLDCDAVDQGCNGGLPDNAYRAIEQLGGLETESDYPYEAEAEKCSYNASLSRVQISGAVNISSNETDMAKWLVANGPISIGINANAMQFYVGGISHPWRMLCNPKNLDHGVLIVGYGEKDYPLFDKKLPYWIIKNSWGESWGEQGYYRVYRGDGTCGVNQMASSAVI